MKTLFSTVALCVVIAFISVASASDHDVATDAPREHQENKHKMKHLFKRLSLTEQQQVQIKAIKAQAKEQHQTLRESMKQFKTAERALLQAEIFDEQAYSALHETFQTVFAQIALVKAKTKHAFFNVLTAEQQEKWLKINNHHKRKAKKARD